MPYILLQAFNVILFLHVVLSTVFSHVIDADWRLCPQVNGFVFFGNPMRTHTGWFYFPFFSTYRRKCLLVLYSCLVPLVVMTLYFPFPLILLPPTPCFGRSPITPPPYSFSTIFLIILIIISALPTGWAPSFPSTPNQNKPCPPPPSTRNSMSVSFD